MDNKYVFVSYAHKDTDRVMSIIRAMKSKGIPLWYDEGIEAGTEWPEYIGERVKEAAVFISFMSPFAAASVNCRNEINYALSLGKEMLIVYLEPTTLSAGMQLQLGSIQAMFYYRSRTEEEFISNLVNAQILKNMFSGSKKTVRTVAKPAPAPITEVKKDLNSSTMIARVKSISSTIESDKAPAGKYSTVISIRNLKSIVFHVFLSKHYEREKEISLSMKIYDSTGHIVCDEKYGFKVKPITESLSLFWNVGCNSGCLITEGDYRAELEIDKTGVYSYNFKVVSETVKEGVLTAISRKFASIEHSFNLPRHSIVDGLWIAFVILVALGAYFLVSHLWPDWLEFLKTPIQDWGKK